MHSLDEEQERELYLATIDELTSAGFEHYEVSNFARPGKRCRHNETYWAAREYYAKTKLFPLMHVVVLRFQLRR